MNDYINVVNNVKTQSCINGRDETLRTGEDYFSCCGISYEYLNYISVRKALQLILDIVNKDLNKKILKEIEDTDNILKELIIRNEENINPIFKQDWWSNYLPYGVRP